MKNKKSLFHKLFGRVITLMVVPHNENRMFQFRIPLFFAVVIFGGVIAMLTYSVMIIKQDVDYQRAQESVKELKEKASVLSEEYGLIQQRVEKFKAEEKKLREMVGLKNRKTLVENGGLGGPTKNDQNLLDSILKSDSDKESLKKSMQDLQAELDEQMESFDEVKKYVSNLTSIWEATPRGRPVDGYVTSKYGQRRAVFDNMGDPDTGEKLEFHAGVDIANRVGSALKATAPGKVIFTGKKGGYGQLVVVDHGYGFVTMYGHCSKIIVKKGDKVNRGDTVSLIGMTGNTTGPHVHYEVRRWGRTTDPSMLDKDFYARR